jgi:hypothetical protein
MAKTHPIWAVLAMMGRSQCGTALCGPDSQAHDRAQLNREPAAWAGVLQTIVTVLPWRPGSEPVPSVLHELLLALVTNRPALAPEALAAALGRSVPPHVLAVAEKADFAEIKVPEYRADLVIVLRDQNGVAVLGIVLEHQLRPSRERLYAWPAYVALLRSRLKCPICLLVTTPLRKTALWARQRIDLGWDNFCQPWVIGPDEAPEVIEEEDAKASPYLAIFAALAHARHKDHAKASRIGGMGYVAIRHLRARGQFDEDQAAMYADVILNALPKD